VGTLERNKSRLRANLYMACALVLVISATLQVVSLVSYAREEAFLVALMNRIASPSLPPSEQAIAISNFLSDKSDRSNRQYFLLPVFGFLRPTAEEVASAGGDCADQSRLTIVLLGLRNIHAEKWALYDPTMKPHHAVVELDSEHGKMVIDPLFNLWFPRPEGGYYGIESLRQNPEILSQRVRDLAARTDDPVRDDQYRLREYPLNRYIYTNARTINWEKSPAMHLAYRILHALLGDRANYISRPEFAERPALMVVYGAIIPEVLALIVLLGAAGREKRMTFPRRTALDPRMSSSPG